MIGKKSTQRFNSIKRILENYKLAKDKDILRYQIYNSEERKFKVV